MKKHIVLATGLAVLSTSAWATKSRLSALGQDTTRGSHFIKDSRNIFRNAAHVNTFKNYVVTEWGQVNAGTPGATVPGTSQNPEGGFFRETGSFAYGAYMGANVDNIDANINSTHSYGGLTTNGTFANGNNFVANSNRWDFFFGGDMGVQWGARIHYGKSNEQAVEGIAVPATATTYEAKHSTFGLGLGAIFGDIEGYANLGFSDKYEGSITGSTATTPSTGEDGDKVEADLSLNLGVSYAMGGMTVFVDYDKMGAEATEEDLAATVIKDLKDEYTNSTIKVGVGHTHEVTSAARVFADFTYTSGKHELKSDSLVTGTIETETIKYTRAPITVGFETDATSWLTLRGSISQNFAFFNKVEETDSTHNTTTAVYRNRDHSKQGTTDVAAGATLTFGKLMVDGMIGTTTTAGGSGEDGNLNLDRVLANVAVHYWF